MTDSYLDLAPILEESEIVTAHERTVLLSLDLSMFQKIHLAHELREVSEALKHVKRARSFITSLIPYSHTDHVEEDSQQSLFQDDAAPVE